MQALITRIRSEGRNLGNGILKVDGFVNHQLDPSLTMDMGAEFSRRFADQGVDDITKIITAEVSGIAPALATGYALGVPVVYARQIPTHHHEERLLQFHCAQPHQGRPG